MSVPAVGTGRDAAEARRLATLAGEVRRVCTFPGAGLLCVVGGVASMRWHWPVAARDGLPLVACRSLTSWADFHPPPVCVWTTPEGPREPTDGAEARQVRRAIPPQGAADGALDADVELREAPWPGSGAGAHVRSSCVDGRGSWGHGSGFEMTPLLPPPPLGLDTYFSIQYPYLARVYSGSPHGICIYSTVDAPH